MRPAIFCVAMLALQKLISKITLKVEYRIMSFFDALRKFFKPTPEEKADKLKEKITNMYGQTADRRYYLEQLYKMGPDLAPKRLIQRFTRTCDNSTNDQEEKDYTKDLLVLLGSASIDPLKEFLRKNDKDFNWPYRTLSELIPNEERIEFLVELLNTIGPDYVRNPERKEQLILVVKSFNEDSIGRAVLPYLADDNETIRFVAAETVIVQAHDYGIEALADRFDVETSGRVLTLIAEAFRDKEWTIPEAKREAVSSHLPSGMRLNSSGVIV